MKDYILATLTAKKGRIASFVAGVLLTLLVRVFTHYGLKIDPYLLDELTAALPFAIAWVIDGVVLQSNAKGVKQIQEAIPDPEVVPDGVPGPKTVAAVQEATSVSSLTEPEIL